MLKHFSAANLLLYISSTCPPFSRVNLFCMPFFYYHSSLEPLELTFVYYFTLDNSVFGTVLAAVFTTTVED